MASMLMLALTLFGFLAQSIVARADSVQSGREEISSVVMDPANSEPVWLEGEMQFVLRETHLHDGTVWREFRSIARGAGLGLWSQTPYQFNETYTYSWIDPVGLEYRADMDDVVRLVSQGADPNVFISQSMSVIRDATGKYTFKFSFDYDVTGREE